MNNILPGSIVTVTGRLVKKENRERAPVTLFEVAVEQSRPQDVNVLKPRPALGTPMKLRNGLIGKLIGNEPTLSDLGGCHWVDVVDLSASELEEFNAEEKKKNEYAWRKQLEKIPDEFLIEIIRERVK